MIIQVLESPLQKIHVVVGQMTAVERYRAGAGIEQFDPWLALAGLLLSMTYPRNGMRVYGPALRGILGELLAIAALVMCMLFVTVDIGRPDRISHIMPLIGTPEQVAKCKASATGQVLARALERQVRAIEEARRQEDEID